MSSTALTGNPDKLPVKPASEHEKTQSGPPQEAGWKKLVTPLVIDLTPLKNLQVNLVTCIPVLIVYGTAAVNEENQIRFFDDIYGYDAALEKSSRRWFSIRLVSEAHVRIREGLFHRKSIV
jgi:hypothetical protein